MKKYNSNYYGIYINKFLTWLLFFGLLAITVYSEYDPMGASLPDTIVICTIMVGGFWFFVTMGGGRLVIVDEQPTKEDEARLWADAEAAERKKNEVNS